MIRAIGAACSGVLLFTAGQVAAQTTNITPDGTLGTVVGQSGGTYSISGGQIVGGENQFHSFSQFDLAFGDTADFTGPAGLLNIVSRVTGTDVSEISGVMQTSVTGANLWFINPNGIVFGQGASLNVSGSFHASTADYLRFDDNSRFYADPAKGASLPGAAAGNPVAFGFLSTQSGDINDIDLNGSQFEVLDGESLSMVGGNVRITDDTNLTANGGRINLASVGDIASEGEVILSSGLDTAGIAYNGDAGVSLEGDVTLDILNGGSLYVRGGQFTMQVNSGATPAIDADTTNVDGGVVDIKVAGPVSIDGSIDAATSGVGNGGSVDIAGSQVSVEGRIEVRSETGATGMAGNVSIRGDQISLLVSSSISSTTAGPGRGGDVDIDASGDVYLNGGTVSALSSGAGHAGNIRIAGANIFNQSSDGFFITADNSGEGHGGDVLLQANESIELGAAILSATTRGERAGGAGGSVELNAPSISIFREIDNNGVRIETRTEGSGDAGGIVLDGDFVELYDDARILSSTNDAGNAGSILINASNVFDMRGPSRIDSSSSGDSSGAAGSIVIDAGTVSIDGSQGLPAISVSTQSANLLNLPGSISITAAESISIDAGNLSSPVLSATTSGDSPAGGISLSAPELNIDSALIEVSTSDDGYAGDLTIIGSDNLNIRDTIVSAGTSGGSGRGGDIVISAGALLIEDSDLLVNSLGGASGAAGNILVSASSGDIVHSYIESVTGGAAAGGNIDFAIDDLLSIFSNDSGDSTITAGTRGGGPGGTVSLSASTLQIEDGTTVDASTTGPGNGGGINIEGGDIVVTDSATISVETSGSGTAGTLTFDADALVVEGTSALIASTDGSGSGGSIEIFATELLVSDDGRIEANSSDDLLVTDSASVSVATSGSGAGGTLTVDATELVVENNGSLVGSNSGTGQGGNIEILGTDVTVRNGGRIAAGTTGDGSGGSITVGSSNLLVLDGGLILAESGSAGQGGSIVVAPDMFTMASGGRIAVNASGSGDAGSIAVDAAETVAMDGSSIESTSAISDGGDVTVNARELVYMTGSSITTSADSQIGNAGNIQIGGNSDPATPTFLIIEDNTVQANAGASGGAINIFAQHVLGAGNTFEAISDTGNDGEIVFDVPPTDFVSVLSQLDVSMLSVTGLLESACAMSALSDRSSLVIDLARTPQTPEYYLTSPPMRQQAVQAATTAGRTTSRPGPSPSAVGC
jgi:filamentous hemagglutinin family protein